MDNRLSKLKFISSISDNILNGKIMSNYTSQEYKNFCDLNSTFCYILMFPENLRLNNVDEIEKICTQGKFYNRMFLKGTMEYENLKNKYPLMAKAFEKGESFSVLRGGDLHYDINAVYEQKDDFVVEYCQFVFKNENKAKFVHKEDGVSFEFPSFVRGAKRLEMINNPKTISMGDNRYKVTLNCMFNNINNNKKVLKTIQVDYVDYDNCLVFQDFYNTMYSDYKNLEGIFNKMVLIGEVEGNLFVLNNWKPISVFHAMRMALAHNPKFNYNIKLNDYVSLIGKVLITNEKSPDDKSQHFNRVLLLDTGVFHHISYLGNIDDSIIEDDLFNSIYVPSVAKDCKDIDELLDKCSYITVKFEKKINKRYALCLIDDILTRNSNNKVVQDIAKNVKSALQKKGFVADVDASPIKNKEIIKTMLKEQAYLVCKNEKQAKKIEKFVYNLLNYYDFKSLVSNENLMRKFGDTNAMKIDNDSIIKIMSYFRHSIFSKASSQKDGRDDECFYTQREMFFVFAYFYAFVALIDNCFAEHLSNNVQKCVDIVSNADFSKFDVIKSVDGEYQKTNPTTFEDKVEVIKYIRNCISHAAVFVEIAKSGEAKECNFVFKNLKFRDKIIKINASDFMDFLKNEDFINYSAFEDDKIESKSFEELLGKIKALTPKVKDYIFD